MGTNLGQKSTLPSLISFSEVMNRVAFPRSIYTFRRLVQEMVKYLDGPVPPIPGHFNEVQAQEFIQRLPQLEVLRRERRSKRREAKDVSILDTKITSGNGGLKRSSIP